MATFKVILEQVTLDGVAYSKGDTFEAREELREHFESNGIAEMQVEKPKKEKKQ